jgi:hypothetical protein
MLERRFWVGQPNIGSALTADAALRCGELPVRAGQRLQQRPSASYATRADLLRRGRSGTGVGFLEVELRQWA